MIYLIDPLIFFCIFGKIENIKLKCLHVLLGKIRSPHQMFYVFSLPIYSCVFWKGVENIPATPWSQSCGRQGRDSERPKPKHHCCMQYHPRHMGRNDVNLGYSWVSRWKGGEKLKCGDFNHGALSGDKFTSFQTLRKWKTISFALGSQKVATFGAKNKPLYKSGSLEIDCDLWDRSQCSGILDQFSTSHNSLLFFKKKMAPIDMSKQMNPTTQSDGIVLAEEASFSDAARVKGPHRKTSSSIVGLEVGWKALKGESLDFSTMLAIYLWHYRFEFSGSFMIRNPKEITWTAIYLWGKESRRRNVGWSSEKRFTRENPFFYLKWPIPYFRICIPFKECLVCNENLLPVAVESERRFDPKLNIFP